MATTLDGKIAKDKNHFPDWTSREDKQFFAKISKKSKVVIFGENTFNTFKKPLKDRLNVVFAKDKKEKQDNIMWVSGKVKPVLSKLEKLGYKSAVLGGGAFLNTLFLKEKLINEIYISINPKIFGNGISLFNDEFDVNLKLVDIIKLNKDAFVVRYKILYN